MTNQTIALAGIAQAVALVDQLATTGTADAGALQASIGSVLKLDSSSVLDVYGGEVMGLKLGLEQLDSQLSGGKTPHREQARYAAMVVFLENQLEGRKDMLRTIKIGIERAQAQTEHFGLLHDNVLANLADIYQSTVSLLDPRIMVTGEQEYLSKTEVANKIRALLLAAVRSTMLWKQCGGARWKFLIFRRRILSEIQLLLTQG